MNAGVIFDIKKFAIHDGPGIRTTVFFKGCPLSCRWCHNPEGISSDLRLVYRDLRCIGCGDCVQVCLQKALEQTPQGIQIDHQRCNCCGDCAAQCPAEAMEVSGKCVTVDELVETIKKDTIFYDQSGGGVTFSGGEPLMQPEFLLAVLESCGRLSIHRTIDTTGHSEAETLAQIAAETDLFLYDLKHMDPLKHQEMTGVSNDLILSNLALLDSLDVEVNVRIPVVPGINTDDRNFERMGQFLSSLACTRKVSLLPYHAQAQGKYGCLGLNFDMPHTRAPAEDALQSVARNLRRFGLQIKIGG